MNIFKSKATFEELAKMIQIDIGEMAISELAYLKNFGKIENPIAWVGWMEKHEISQTQLLKKFGPGTYYYLDAGKIITSFPIKYA
jgi:hypothetical protein